MATKNDNPIVGTFPCADCGEVATLLVTLRGKKKDLLYKRCGCGCDQRTGQAVQKKWRERMTPRPGYEHLKMEPAKPKQEPDEQPQDEPKIQPKGPGGFAAIAGLILGVGLFALTAGRAST